jgi:hypothetical protein
MNSHLAAKTPSFCVANLRNSWLLRAIGALNLNLFAGNPLRPEQSRSSLAHKKNGVLSNQRKSNGR